MIVCLTGGTGGAKLVEGLAAEIGAADLTIICNTADDCNVHGLHISPDIDTVLYTLAGILDPEKGWGIRGETFIVLEQLQRLGAETWFRLGDRDLATHIWRTHQLKEGRSLSAATDLLRRKLGVSAAILPMSDDPIETRLVTPEGELSFQEYFVKTRWQKEVTAIRLAGAAECRPAPGVIDAIARADSVILCPSNPITSIGPILAVPGIRSALVRTNAVVMGVSPIIGNTAISGPAHKLMVTAGFEPSAVGVAKAYGDFIDVFMFAAEDESRKHELHQLGIKAFPSEIRMRDASDKRRLARELMALLGK